MGLVGLGACDLDPEGPGENGEECASPEALTGESVWSRTEDVTVPEQVVHAESEDGGFYLAYDGARPECVSRHDGDGEQLWSVSGTACDRLALDSGGNLLLAGAAQGARLEDDFARIAKLGPDGEQEWVVERSPLGSKSEAHDVVTDPEDGVFVTGMDTTYLEPVGTERTSWVMKLDASGSEEWFVSLEGIPLHEEFAKSQISVDGLGRTTVARLLGGGDGEDDFARLDRLDPSGQPLWSVDIEGPNINVEAMGVDDQGNSLVGIYTYDYSVESDVGYARTLTLYDPEGAPLWTKSTRDTPWLGSTYDIAFDPCGTIVVAGGASDHAWVAKLSSDGELLWSQTSDDEDTLFRSVSVDARGQIVAAGHATVGWRPDVEFDTPIRERLLARFGA